MTVGRATEEHRLGRPAAMAAVAFWSAGNIMVRAADLSALPLAFWRGALGAVVYSAVLTARGQRLRWKAFRASIPAGVLTGVWVAVFFESIKSTTIANATMIGALLPVVLLGVAARRFGEPISLWLCGMATVAVAGTALVLFGSAAAPVWSVRGDSLAVLALILWSLVFALSKEARQHAGTVEFQASVWIVGTLVLAPVAAVAGGGIEWPSPTGLAWAAALLAVPGTGHLLMNWAHRHVRLTATSMITLGAPPASMIGAAVFLSEPIAAIQAAGAAVVIAALAAVIRRDAQITARHSLGEAPA